MNIIKRLSIVTLAGMFVVNASSHSFSQSSDIKVGKDVREGDTSVHTIIKGDTLWDISGEYLKNPFLWPNIWENNDYIRNPDLIYPGNKLIIPSVILSAPEAGKEEAPVSAVEATLPVQPETQAAEEPISLLPADMTMRTVKPPAPAAPAAPSAVRPAITADTIEAGGYIINNIESYGVIRGAKEDRNIFAEGDVVNLTLSNSYAARVSFGEKFTIFRTSGPVVHPSTRKGAGYLFIPIGVIEINRLQGNDASGKIIRSYNYALVGDQIQPYVPAQPVNRIVKAASQVKGYIIEAQESSVLNAQYSVVYLDKGAADGIIPGTILYVIRENKDEIIGELRVLSVQDSTSTAFVVRSMEPFGTGSRVTTAVK